MSGSDVAAPAVPLPGQADLPAPSVAALLRRNAADPAIADRPAVLFDDEAITHVQLHEIALRWAAWLTSLRREGEPFHVGVLLENTPTYIAALCGAAIAGATVVGLNDTRRGDALARDINHTDISILIVQSDHVAMIDEVLDLTKVDRDRIFTSHRYANDPTDSVGLGLEQALVAVDGGLVVDDPAGDPAVETTWCLVLTSGTTSAPKAVICSQRRMLVTGERMRLMLEVTPDDRGYISMPLFHSNSLMVGMMPALVAGASVALARKFTASRWVDDVRRYRATWFNYTGKPLSYIMATPARDNDLDNPVTRAFGNEGSPDVQRRFSERFGVRVIDMFGPTEGGVGLIGNEDLPPGALGHAGEALTVVAEDGTPQSVAVLDEEGRILNPDECVGEIVNTAGPGPFEGYYNDEEAFARATRNGWYWTGDLGYIDSDGYLYFAGRTSDWLRVDGENFPAGPIEQIIAQHPAVTVAAIYGVPDTDAGDQVMATLVMDDPGSFDPTAFARWLDQRPDMGPKWRPRYVRLATDVPRTATNKILVRTLQHQKFRLDRVAGDSVWVRERGAEQYRPLTGDDMTVLEAAFTTAGRLRFWDL